MTAEHHRVPFLTAYIQVTHLDDAALRITPQTPPAVIPGDVAHW